MDSLQVNYRNPRTGIIFGLTPNKKYVHPKKEANLTCLFVISTKKTKYDPKRRPVEVAIVVCSTSTDVEVTRNIKRGIKKAFKHMKDDDVLHIVNCEMEKSDMVKVNLKEKEKFSSNIESNYGKGECNSRNFEAGLKRGYSYLISDKTNILKHLVILFEGGKGINYKKRTKSEFVKLTTKHYLKDGISTSGIGIGEQFDEVFLHSLAKAGAGNYYFIGNPLDIPKKMSKEIHGITDLCLVRNACIELTPRNGMKIDPSATTKCCGVFSEGGGGGGILSKKKMDDQKVILTLGHVHKNTLRKILLEISLKFKDSKISEVLEFTFRFVPVDSISGAMEEIVGKMRIYSSKESHQLSSVEKVELLDMAVNIRDFSEEDERIYKDFSKKNDKKAREKAQRAQKRLTKFLGKDSTGHIDKLIRILFGHSDEIKTQKSCEMLAKSYHHSARIIERDNDFGYLSGKDSDFGCWSDIEDNNSTSGEDSEDYDHDNVSNSEDQDDDDFGNYSDSDDNDGFDDDIEDEMEDEFGEEDLYGGFIPSVERSGGVEVVVVDALKIIKEQQQKVMDVAEALNVTVGVAGQLLKYFNWNNENLYREFFDNKEKLIRKANINITNIPFHTGRREEMECPVCYDDFDGKQMYSLACKHFFCRNCWKSYLIVQVAEGAPCLMSPCPWKGCDIIVGEEMFKEMLDEKNLALYNRYLLRSFVDDNPKIKWCPAPDCGRAVFCPDLKAENVKCSCGQKFCFKCQQEAHEPCSCKALRAWKVKEKDESETANWLTVHTKICPKCDKAIEKNGGCNHMSCSQCKHEFCWICMDPWSQHGSKTGGFYSCNKYKPDELKKKLKSDKINDARSALEKYMHYFKRYANHLNSQKFEEELKKKCEIKMRKLQMIHKYSSWNDVEYIQKGIDQLIECRRTMKYTYIHAYYLEEGSVKTLFEFLQTDLERETERLSGLLEAEIERFNKEEIMASSKSSQKRLEHLLTGVKQGLIVQN